MTKASHVLTNQVDANHSLAYSFLVWLLEHGVASFKVRAHSVKGLLKPNLLLRAAALRMPQDNLLRMLGRSYQPYPSAAVTPKLFHNPSAHRQPLRQPAPQAF